MYLLVGLCFLSIRYVGGGGVCVERGCGVEKGDGAMWDRRVFSFLYDTYFFGELVRLGAGG